MLAFFVTLQSFIADRVERDDKGATAVEYGLMVGLIAIAIIATVGFLGVSLNDLFVSIEASIDAVTP